MKTDASHDNSQGCKFCLGAAYTSDPFEVKTKAGSIVFSPFNYCPNCGRDLRKEVNNDGEY